MGCVSDDRQFELTKDPRKCKFGQWYYAFRTEDAVLRMELERFEQPHAAIHGLADEVLELAATGQKQQALQIIESARDGLLNELLQLFDGARSRSRAEAGALVRRAAAGADRRLPADRRGSRTVASEPPGARRRPRTGRPIDLECKLNGRALSQTAEGVMREPQPKLVHFVPLGTHAPICGGAAADANRIAGDGITICRWCARRLLDRIDRRAPFTVADLKPPLPH